MEKIWSTICSTLREKVGEDTCQRWFDPLYLIEANEKTLTLLVPNEIFQYWIESNYRDLLLQAIESKLMGQRDVCYVVAKDGEELPRDRPSGSESTETSRGDTEPASVCEADFFPGSTAVQGELPGMPEPVINLSPDFDLPDDVFRAIKRTGLNSRYRFDTFVSGGSTEFAYAAAVSVGERPGSSYNPFFIHGGPGLGKTHLLHAIGRAILINDPRKKVVLVTSETFSNEFIEAIQNQSLTKFRNRYRKADVLLIDDIQFLAGKEKTQDEFFHTFNCLADGRRQIVMTSDCAASEISNLEKRISTRCEWGLTAEIIPPDPETRLAILRRKMKELNLKLPDWTVEFLADRIRKSVRRLEGALLCLASYYSISGKILTAEIVERLLKDTLKEEGRRRVSISRIQREVADFFDIRLQDMTSNRRPASIAHPRQVAMFLSRELTDLSLVEIGRNFGGRDHGTVIYACKSVQKRMENDRDFRQQVNNLSTKLTT